MTPVEAKQIILEMTGRKNGASSSEIYNSSPKKDHDTLFHEIKLFILAGEIIQKGDRWYKK